MTSATHRPRRAHRPPTPRPAGRRATPAPLPPEAALTTEPDTAPAAPEDPDALTPWAPAAVRANLQTERDTDVDQQALHEPDSALGPPEPL